MAISKYFSITAKPTIPVASLIQSNKTDLPFSAGDLLADWVAFDVPKGPCKLVSLTVLIRGENGAAQTNRDLQVFFGKSDSDGTAPASLGTENAAVSQTTTYQNNIIGHQVLDIATMTTRLTHMTVATTGAASADSLTPGNCNIIMQGEPDSGTNVGYDKLYVALVAGASNTWDFATGVLLNDGDNVAIGDTVLTVDGVDARIVFAPGDVILKHDSDTAVGTVKSVDSDTQITLTSGSGVAITDDDELINSQPLTVIMGFER